MIPTIITYLTPTLNQAFIPITFTMSLRQSLRCSIIHLNHKTNNIHFKIHSKVIMSPSTRTIRLRSNKDRPSQAIYSPKMTINSVFQLITNNNRSDRHSFASNKNTEGISTPISFTIWLGGS